METETLDNTKEKALQIVKKQIEEINVKLKNNDYDECNKINHDKMVLENRKMILENKILLLELYKDSSKMDNQYFNYAEKNNLIIGEIVKEISKNNMISDDTKEKIHELLSKIKPKKLTVNTGIVKIEW